MRKSSTYISLVCAVALLPLFSNTANACSCIMSIEGTPPCQAYWNARVVFVGLATDVSVIPLDLGNGQRGYQQRRFRFSVEEAFRGVQERSVEVLTGMGGGDCGYDFKVGERYFIYAGRNPKNNILYVGICGRTLPLDKAADDLEYARGLLKSGGVQAGASIYGVVIRNTRSSYVDYGRREGMAGVRVTIEGNDKHYDVVTGSDGRFQRNKLPAGSYKVRAELPDNLSKVAEQQIVVAEGRCAGAAFITTSLGSAKGRLLTYEGEAASKLNVNLIPADTEGKEEEWRGREISGYTDKDGRYIFSQIPSGRYVVVINYKGQPGQFDPPYPRTYLPGTSDPAQATILTIAEGQEIEAADFHLPPKLVERTIQGTVEWPDGSPVAGAIVSLDFVEREWSEMGISTNNQGRFSIKCYDGRYLIHADSAYEAAGRKRMHAEPLPVTAAEKTEPVKLVLVLPGYDNTYSRPRKQKKKQ